jgi:hypothetical protein
MVVCGAGGAGCLVLGPTRIQGDSGVVGECVFATDRRVVRWLVS